MHKDIETTKETTNSNFMEKLVFQLLTIFFVYLLIKYLIPQIYPTEIEQKTKDKLNLDESGPEIVKKKEGLNQSVWNISLNYFWV